MFKLSRRLVTINGFLWAIYRTQFIGIGNGVAENNYERTEEETGVYDDSGLSRLCVRLCVVAVVLQTCAARKVGRDEGKAGWRERSGRTRGREGE